MRSLYVVFLVLLLAGAAWAGVVTRVSVAGDGAQSLGGVDGCAVSATGRYVAFMSTAALPGFAPKQLAIFVRDAGRGRTDAASLAPGGQPPNGVCLSPSISADGTRVVFSSSADNLVPGDTNRTFDIFLRDRVHNVTQRISLAPGGRQANGPSTAPVITPDGRCIVYLSAASNLAPGDSNGKVDVFVYDRYAKTTRRVSVGAPGVQANADCRAVRISDDGNLVAFTSAASTLTPGDTNEGADVFVRDLVAGVTTRVPLPRGGSVVEPFLALSGDGRVIAFTSASRELAPGDANEAADVFVYDRSRKRLECVSVTPAGAPGNGFSQGCEISGDGRYVAFSSDAGDLVPGEAGHTHVYLRDRQEGVTTRLTLTPDSAPAATRMRNAVVPLALSRDGRFTAFRYDAPDLVAGETNDRYDIYLYDRQPEGSAPAAPTPAAITAARAAGTRRVVMTTARGDIVLELYGHEAPLTVANFVQLARAGFYNGLTFHRVETDPTFSLIQGGDPDGNGTGGPGHAIKLEIAPALTHVTGAIGMARTADPDSAGSQFYICLVPIHALDGQYAVFGKVTAGLDVAKAIRRGDKIIAVTVE